MSNEKERVNLKSENASIQKGTVITTENEEVAKVLKALGYTEVSEKKFFHEEHGL